MIAYKLFNKRRDGTYGSLFINRKQKLHKGILYKAEDHQTKGYKHRPGWHVLRAPEAPHLSSKNRVWCKVAVYNIEFIKRPKSQGGVWVLATEMMILEELSDL